VPGKAVEDRHPKPGSGGRPRYHRPSEEAIEKAIRSALARPSSKVSSQRALLARVLPILRRRDPIAALGGRRLREVLVEVPGVRFDVTYREEVSRRPITRCPVCSAGLRPIRNRTLDEDRVTLGYQCERCGYWTHLRRRVPVRYAIRIGAARLTPSVS
jgi:DNA-directed RNA polymerase subunit RPC12/RpoP